MERYMKRFRITKEGFNKLKEELDNLLIVERPAIAKAIGEAKEHGDLSENEEYSTAMDKQKFIENSIAEISERLSNANIVDIKDFSGENINFGAKVKLLDLNTDKKVNYQLLSEFEADINKGSIAVESPVGKALVNKKVGDIIEIKIPSGIKEYEVLEVKY
jgi:transcription elongation factor GreA